MNMGQRSGRAICEGRKTSLIAPGTDRHWLPKLTAESTVRLNFNGRHKGWVIVKVTGCCYHEGIAEIPGCSSRHDPNAIDSEDTWEQILHKALSGGTAPGTVEAMEARAAEGGYVVDFAVAWRHRAWCAALGIAVAEPS